MYYYWNLTSSECTQVFNRLKESKPVLLTLYNSFNSLDNSIFKIKIPNVKLDVIDKENNPLNAVVICSNRTDANDCDLYI